MEHGNLYGLTEDDNLIDTTNINPAKEEYIINLQLAEIMRRLDRLEHYSIS